MAASLVHRGEAFGLKETSSENDKVETPVSSRFRGRSNTVCSNRKSAKRSVIVREVEDGLRAPHF